MTSRVFLLAVVSLTLSAFGCRKSVEIEYVATPGEVATSLDEILESYEGYVLRLPDDESPEVGEVRRTVKLYPTEAYFGDPIYIAEYLENVSDETIPNFDKYLPEVWDMPGVALWISSPQVEGKYRWRFENPTGYIADRLGEPKPFEPGEKFCSKILYPELCPLEDYDAPFWKELREKLTPEGIACTIEIKYNDKTVVTQDILVKPRPVEETALLAKWYKNTPKELFPSQYEGALPNSGKSNIRLSPIPVRTYSPWLFVYAGYRKPSDPNNPTTVEGWRDLETSLVPSAMRDEVRLARLRLEYFATRDPDEARKVKKEYDEWLASLPEVQRDVMTRRPYCYGESYKDVAEINATFYRLTR